MRRFTRRDYANDEKGYKNLVAQRDDTAHKLNQFVKEWVAPAKQKELNELISRLIYTNQQTVSYQTENEVDEGDIRIY